MIVCFYENSEEQLVLVIMIYFCNAIFISIHGSLEGWSRKKKVRSHNFSVSR